VFPGFPEDLADQLVQSLLEFLEDQFHHLDLKFQMNRLDHLLQPDLEFLVDLAVQSAQLHQMFQKNHLLQQVQSLLEVQ
jgi:hypothetical protein